MTTRSILLFASVAALGFAAPAIAQDAHEDMPHGAEHHGDPVTSDGNYDGAWQGNWSDKETWHGEWTGAYTDAEGRTVDATYHGVFIGEHRFMSEDGHVLAHDGLSRACSQPSSR